MAKQKRKATGKRANDTGTLWTDPKSGKLYAVITWTVLEHGVRKQKRRARCAQTGTKTEAYELIKELQTEVEAERERELARIDAQLDGTVGKDRNVNPKTLKFGELAAYHRDDNLTPAEFDEKTGIKKSGLLAWKDARRTVARLVQYFGANKLVSSFTVGQIRKFKEHRLSEPATARFKQAGADKMITKELTDANGDVRTITFATVHRDLAQLRRMLNYAVAERWLLTANPMTGHKDLINPKSENMREDIASVDAEHALIDHCYTEPKREYLAPYLEVMFDSGCRSIELRRMRVCDVEFDAAVDGVADVGVFHVYSFKGRRRKDREHVMTPRARAALLKLCAGKQATDYVFSIDVKKKHADGTDYVEHRMMKYAPRKAFLSAKREATKHSKGQFDLSHFRGHDIRHTVVTRLMELGETAENAGKHVGHEQPSTTWRYNNPDQSSRARCANKLAIYSAGKVVAFKRKRKAA